MPVLQCLWPIQSSEVWMHPPKFAVCPDTRKGACTCSAGLENYTSVVQRLLGFGNAQFSPTLFSSFQSAQPLNIIGTQVQMDSASVSLTAA